ncbi:MAG: 2'-5' RNA ligase family protein [Ferruginibacter sp.]|nr:2'-5' RNA ligase family protein [Ferruginibacter sp.]
MNNISKNPPLIVTLKIDETAQKFFDAERKKYFPAYCNYVDAHITLFHKLPSNKIEIDNSIEKFSKRKPFELDITNIILQENGVAYEIESEELLQLHKAMQEDLSRYLIRNDRKKLWPHITIQSKVTGYKAFKTHKALLSAFKPISATAIGFSCWYYLKGYWKMKEEYLFR